MQGNSLSSITLCLLQDVQLKITGHVSGKIYFFKGAGSKNDVNEEDVEYFMSLRSGGCCGSTPSPIFEIAR
jgi:hypothetical protein